MGGKGCGKGHNCNVPGLPNSTIDNLPKSGVAVFRDGAEQAVDFCEKLRLALLQFEPGEVFFDNIDVSNVQWTALSFSVLLDVLQEKAAQTKRLKAFKAALDDDCIRLMAAWLESLPAEGLPSEIHLSHNQITKEGFDALMNAIESKRSELFSPAIPIWLRVESNRLDISNEGPVVKPLIEEGRLELVGNVRDRRPSTAAVAMPTFNKPAGGHQPHIVNPPAMMALAGAGPAQGGKGGNRYAPAAPWDAGRSSGGSSWESSSWNRSSGSWDQGRNSSGWWKAAGSNWWDKSSGSWDKPDWQEEQAGAAQVTQAEVVTASGGSSARFQAALAHAAAATADRSRTPPPRKAPPEERLPPNWEKQWSDEYQIPYYWNKVTGESIWEPPKE